MATALRVPALAPTAYAPSPRATSPRVSPPRPAPVLAAPTIAPAPAAADPHDDAVAAPAPPHRLLVPDGRRLRLVALADVAYVESRGNYALLRTAGRNLMYRITMTALEARLAPHDFARVHRRVLVNLSRVRSVERTRLGARQVVLHDGTRLPVSRDGWRTLRARLA